MLFPSEVMIIAVVHARYEEKMCNKYKGKKYIAGSTKDCSAKPG